MMSQSKGVAPILAAFLIGVLGVSTAPAAQTPEATADAIIQATGFKGGLVVHVGCGDGKLLAALGTHQGTKVHGLEHAADKVARVRADLLAKGLHGKVTVQTWSGKQLPFVDNLVNLLIVEKGVAPARDEMLRVLVPNGVAYLEQGGHWAKITKPRPDTIDEWTHYMHDATGNAVAHDEEIAPLRHLQWVGSPRWSRHHDHMASMSAMVSSGGRVFYIMDEGSRASIVLPSRWALYARDAFNGTILWRREMGKWHTQLWPLKSGPAQLPRRLVAIGDTLYVTLDINAPLTALDAATGKRLRTYEGTKSTEEIICSDGVLFVQVNTSGEPWGADWADAERVRDIRKGVTDPRWSGAPRTIMAIRAETGERLWKADHKVVPLTLAADGKHVYLHDTQKIVCLDRATGKQVWASEPMPVWKKIHSWFAPTLVAYGDMVLFAGGSKMVPHRGGQDQVVGLCAKTGKKLWSADHPPCGYQSPEDLLVAGGLAWSGSTTSGGYDGIHRGLDPRTGEVKSQFGPDVETYWFHHRCYRAKATDNYVLTSRTGIEFLDLDKKTWIIHHWVRGGCLYGIMPCNGMVYAPPHNCACYPEAKLYGLNALAPSSPTRKQPMDVPEAGRLEKGPAYGKSDAAPAADADWPTYRGCKGRSGRLDKAVPERLTKAWSKKLGDRLTSPVIAAGKIFLACKDTHTLFALDADTGEKVWQVTAGGCIDSPPTYSDGMLLFGSADGYVTCLRASDGAMAWRYRAAPADRRLMAFEQLESVWPVHGSVLVHDGIVYCVAGRSMFLDGGLILYRLDAKTGRKLSQTMMDEQDPTAEKKTLQDRIQILNMPVGLPDILSTDGQHVYMRSQLFDFAGKRVELGPHSGDPRGQGSVQHGASAHLFAPTGYLDDSWFHRAYWVYGRSFAGGHAGYYQAGKYAPSGRILAYDNDRVYGYCRKEQYYRWTTPLEYHLFASNRQPPKVDVPRGGKGSVVRVGKTPSLNPKGKPVAVEAWVRPSKTNGVILARGGPAHGYALILRGGKPRFVTRIDSSVHAVDAKQNIGKQWTHLVGALTKDKQLEIYVNGKLSARAKAPGFITADPHQAMEIGCDDGGAVGDYKSPFGFTGIIDEVRVYHGTLTADEVRRHYAKPGVVEAKDAELVLSYSFNKGKATDESGHKNHGKIQETQQAKGKVAYALMFTGRMKRFGHHAVKYHWTQEIPLLVRAMVITGQTLFVAGPPDVLDEEAYVHSINDPKLEAKAAEQDAALQGRHGCKLWAVSTRDGKKLTGYDLKQMPIFDGLAAAEGKLFMVTTGGEVLCLQEAGTE